MSAPTLPCGCGFNSAGAQCTIGFGCTTDHAVAARVSVHTETRSVKMPPGYHVGDEEWVAIVVLTDGGGYRIPTGSERTCWRAIWAMENAGMVIPDRVLDEATA